MDQSHSDLRDRCAAALRELTATQQGLSKEWKNVQPCVAHAAHLLLAQSQQHEARLTALEAKTDQILHAVELIARDCRLKERRYQMDRYQMDRYQMDRYQMDRAASPNEAPALPREAWREMTREVRRLRCAWAARAGPNGAATVRRWRWGGDGLPQADAAIPWAALPGPARDADGVWAWRAARPTVIGVRRDGLFRLAACLVRVGGGGGADGLELRVGGAAVVHLAANGATRYTTTGRGGRAAACVTSSLADYVRLRAGCVITAHCHTGVKESGATYEAFVEMEFIAD